MEGKGKNLNFIIFPSNNGTKVNRTELVVISLNRQRGFSPDDKWGRGKGNTFWCAGLNPGVGIQEKQKQNCIPMYS